MGVRSDVGIALKKGLAKKVLKECEELFDYADEHLKHKEGSLFVFRDIKWYTVEDKGIALLYKFLQRAKAAHYLVVEACLDYPASDEGDIGGWYYNPWGLCKCVSATIEYEKKP